MKLLTSQNEGYGFFGTMEGAGESGATAWDIASRKLIEAVSAGQPDQDTAAGVREFLDSRLGRHFADSVCSNIQTAAATGNLLERAIDLAIAEAQVWTINRRTSREEGIPEGLPYLTGWILHFAITAESRV